MRLGFDVKGDISQIMQDETQLGKLAVSAAMRSVARDVQLDWRAQIVAAGLGARLGNSIRSKVYPEGKPSLNAAALVFTNADKIIAPNETGALIRSQNGFWLAIPLTAAGKSARRGRISPGEWESRTGRKLAFVYRAGRSALLVDTGKVADRARTMGRDGFSRAARGSKGRSVPMFVLVPQVRLPKRLSLLSKSQTIAGSVPARIASQWK